MDFNSLVSVFSSVGFPVACCCYLFYSNEKLRETIAENTKAILSLKSLIIQHNLEQHRDEGGDNFV